MFGAIMHRTAPWEVLKNVLASEHEALAKLLERGLLSKEVHDRLASSASMTAATFDLARESYDVLVLLIDKSHSILKRGLTDAMIEGQHAAIEALSAADTESSIVLSQFLFDHEVHELQPLMEFRVEGQKNAAPAIVRLDQTNYKPGGGTALRDTILRAISSLAPGTWANLDEGYRFENRILVVTDGVDEHSNSTASEVAEVLKTASKLRPPLLSYIGLLGIGDEKQFTDAGRAMGIDASRIMTCDADPQKIRAAMALASSKAIMDKASV